MTTVALNLTLTNPHNPKLTLTTPNLTLNNLQNVTYTKVANSMIIIIIINVNDNH